MVETIIWLIDKAAATYNLILLARVFMSFMDVSLQDPIPRFLYRATEPLLAPIRRYLPALAGIDFSPLVLFLVIRFVRTGLIRFVLIVSGHL